jgi:hypothetical protein
MPFPKPFTALNPSPLSSAGTSRRSSTSSPPERDHKSSNDSLLKRDDAPNEVRRHIAEITREAVLNTWTRPVSDAYLSQLVDEMEVELGVKRA